MVCMKGGFATEESRLFSNMVNGEDNAMLWGLVACLCGVVVLVILGLRCSRGMNDPLDVIRALRSDTSMVVDSVGETSTEHLFTVSISTLKQTFDLNLIYNQLRGTNCRLVSTADSAHPSFRKLGLAVPKQGPSMCSASVVVVMGIVMGVGVFQIPVIYNYLRPWMNRFDEFVQTETETSFGI